VSGVPISPRLVKGGLVLVDPATATVQRVITLQYNPDTLTRTLQTQAFTTGSEGGTRAEALRLKGPPIETIKLDAEIDATDQMEAGDSQTARTGIHAQLAALETIVYPPADQLDANDALSRSGALEIVPMQASLTLFVWSKTRILPVRITDFSITEEAFDPQLNPIRAKVSLSLRVLSVDDLGFDTRGGSLFMIYQRQKEQLARQNRSGGLSALGIEALP
jgi:contractile injection system tube protein